MSLLSNFFNIENHVLTVAEVLAHLRIGAVPRSTLSDAAAESNISGD
jgi:hypothetical protein